MKILKSLTALLPEPSKKIRGIAVAFDGEQVTLRTFDGRLVDVPLETISGAIGVNQVVTARVRAPKSDFKRYVAQK